MHIFDISIEINPYNNNMILKLIVILFLFIIDINTLLISMI